ncbi:MAG: lipocalin family protein [Chromatiales bacterium]|jgi:apolipoprotein D and lipocalin family protein
MHRVAFMIVVLGLVACTGLPQGVKPVDGFDLDRYLGKWYEIARLDHGFERGLIRVSAEYSLRDDGGVEVLNRGYSPADKQWKKATGKAYFVGGSDEGYLKVSFFGPFYGSYVVFGLDQVDYQYAFVAGYDKSYLWLLSRTPKVNEELLKRFVDRAKALGFATDNLIYVDQD